MAPFRFRLESVLHLREHETRLSKQELAMAQAAARSAQEALNQAHAERIAFAQTLERKRRQGMTVAEWRTSDWEQERLTDQEAEAGQQYHEALLEVADKRLKLSEARRREKTLEKLKEKHAEQHRMDEQAAERMMLDEIGQQLYLRQLRGTGIDIR